MQLAVLSESVCTRVAAVRWARCTRWGHFCPNSSPSATACNACVCSTAHDSWRSQLSTLIPTLRRPRKACEGHETTSVMVGTKMSPTPLSECKSRQLNTGSTYSLRTGLSYINGRKVVETEKIIFQKQKKRGSNSCQFG